MLEFKVILCPIDFSEFSVRAYRHALSLAEHYHARLVVHHVVELWQHPAVSFAASAALLDEYCQSIRENAKEKLREFVKMYTHNAIQPELVVDEGMAADAILAFAKEQKADLIVMGTHGRRGYDRLMLGSATDRVMRRASCPVLAVREPPRDSVAAGKHQGHAHHLNKILFCADFSATSAAALNYAISTAEEYNAELTLLNVLEDSPKPDHMEKAIAAATERLNALVPADARKALKIKAAVRIGKPYAQIIEFIVEHQIDMVCMGARGHGALDLAVFGSTTYRVMQLGPCPVLAVHV